VRQAEAEAQAGFSTTLADAESIINLELLLSPVILIVQGSDIFIIIHKNIKNFTKILLIN
jgi:hypothetical protein